MDLLQPLNCISPKYFVLAQRQLIMLAAPSLSHSRILVIVQLYLSRFQPADVSSFLGTEPGRVCSVYLGGEWV